MATAAAPRRAAPEERFAARARRLARGVVEGIGEHDLTAGASAIAFRVLFAIVPFVLFALALCGFLGLSEAWTEELAPDVRDSTSAAAFAVLDDTVTRVLEGRQVFWLTAGLALAVWEVSSAVRAAITSLERIHGASSERPWRERYGVSILLALAVGVLLLGAVAAVRALPLLADDGVAGAFVGVVRWPIAVALVALAVGLVVHFGPDAERRLGWVSFGTGVITASWLLASVAFTAYVTQVADYGSAFGGLSVVIVLLLYLYVASLAFTVGALLDRLLADEAAPGDARA